MTQASNTLSAISCKLAHNKAIAYMVKIKGIYHKNLLLYPGFLGLHSYKFHI